VVQFVDGGDTFRQATSLGTAVLRPNALASIAVGDSLSPNLGETVDWFRFRIRGRASKNSSTTLSFAGDPLASSMTLYRESKGKPGKRVARLDLVNSVKTIKPLAAGKYFIKFTGSGVPPGVSGNFNGIYNGNISTFVPPTNLG
jgi:hypothetical protein